MICNNLVTMYYDRAKERNISDIRIGLGYTAVLLDDGRCGLAWTGTGGKKTCCSLMEDAGFLIGKSAAELIHFYPSHNPLKASVGLATINSLANYEETEKVEGDILEHLNLKPDDRVGIIGDFKPLVKEIEKITEKIFIFEKNFSDSKYFVPETEISKILPDCSVVLITATSLVNKTFESLIELIKNVPSCTMLGPSTPLVPAFFSDKNIRILSGVQVIDTDRVLKVVSQAGGMKSFKDFVKKVNVFI
ncbi:MAG: DUF364 domain-containing protein [Candidatus Eremiobacterota bacterium]